LKHDRPNSGQIGESQTGNVTRQRDNTARMGPQARIQVRRIRALEENKIEDIESLRQGRRRYSKTQEPGTSVLD